MCMVMKGYNDFADNRAKSFLAAPLLRQPAMNKIRLKLVDINQIKACVCGVRAFELKIVYLFAVYT